MSSEADRPPQSTAAASMERVLRAERGVEESVAECHREAERMLEKARDHARHITHRTDRRISALHARCSASIEAQIETMRRDAAAAERRKALRERDRDCLSLAVERLAAKLTRDDHDRQD